MSEFQESLQQKDKTITELQRTISEHERKTQQLEQGATASRDTPPQQEPVETRQTTVAAAQKDISKMRWREGKNAPVVMSRGAAVVHGNTAYFRPGGSQLKSTHIRTFMEKNSGLSYQIILIVGLVWQLLMVYSLVWVVVVPLTLSSVSQEKVRGNSGLRSSLPCLHHVAVQLVSLLNRL